MPKCKTKVRAQDRVHEEAMSGFKRELNLDRFREANPQLWIQSQRIGRLLEIQAEMPDHAFPEGSCFLHANLVTVSSFCIKRIKEVNLEACQVTVEIHGDEDLEAGIIIIPLETIEWFGFPSTAVPIGIHFQGFTVSDVAPKVKVEEKKPKLIEKTRPGAKPLPALTPAATKLRK
jgi:hypothetical protein